MKNKIKEYLALIGIVIILVIMAGLFLVGIAEPFLRAASMLKWLFN